MSKHYRKKRENETDEIIDETVLSTKEKYDLEKKKKLELKEKEEKKKKKRKKKKTNSNIVAKIFAIVMLILMVGSVVASIFSYIK